MSYINAIRSGEDVIVWERVEGIREIKRFPCPYFFYVKDPNGKFTSMYGDKLTRLDFDTYQDFSQARMNYKSSNIELFESDIPSEVKILSEKYYNVPAPKLNVTFFDIEVDYTPELGFSSIENPYAPINSVALYHTWSNRMLVIAVPPTHYDVSSLDDLECIKSKLNKMAPLPTDSDVELLFVKDEKELLLNFIFETQDSDLLSGWNSEFFDIPYIGKRLEKYGPKLFKMLCFPEARPPKWREVEVNFRTHQVLDLSGRIHLDMLALFKKYEMEQRPSYKLESIADELLPELPKLKYEGSLAKLYKNDFLFFIRYNLRDTEILKGFEERLGYVDLANQMCHLSTGLFTHVGGTLKLAELAVVNFCHHELNLVVNDVKEPSIDKSIDGALVLLPQKGVHEFIGSIDINSLYPSSIRSLNISPETIRGQFVEQVTAAEEIGKKSDRYLTLTLENGLSETKTAEEWRAFLKEKKWAVSGYGTVFDQSKQGIVPAILESWYATRKKYQKLKGEAKKGGDKLKETYFDKLQYTYKIKLNSFYGALTNLYFRFYDLRMGESTTGTGRMILKHQCRMVNKILEGKYDVEFPLYETVNDHRDSHHSEREQINPIDLKYTLHGPYFNGKFESDCVLYGDTDSTYFKTYATSVEEAIAIADAVAQQVNKSYKKFMQDAFLCNPGFDDIIKAGREIVSDRGIFVTKKRYILHIVDIEGSKVDKMKVMGLDTKKTSLPKEISKELNKFIERFLKGEDWAVIELDIVALKDRLFTTSEIMSIGLPKGVQKVEDYSKQLSYDNNARLPGHVANSIHWNKQLEEHNDKESPKILSGMKIKNFYLTVKQDRFKGIAVPVDIEVMPDWFTENFAPFIDREMQVERLVDNPLQNILDAIGKRAPSKQTLLFDSLLGD